MRPLAAAILTLSVGSLAACGGESRTMFDDATKPVTVGVGSEFDLAMKSNQSTGYQWVLVDSAALGPLRFVSKDYAVPREYRDNNGAGGTERWTFRAPAAGDGVVSLVYKRPWESVPPVDSARFRVTVR
jgi:inhibitor of cysteine peptidase